MKRNVWFAIGTALLVAVLAGGSVSANTLLYDGFGPDVDTDDVGYQIAARQSGTMAPKTYEEREDTKVGGVANSRTAIQWWYGYGRDVTTQRSLVLGAGTQWPQFPNNEFTWVSPNANFRSTDLYEIDLKISCWDYSGGTDEPNRYSGIAFGANAMGQRADAAAPGFGFALTGNYKPASSGGEPTWKFYDAGVVVASGYKSGVTSGTGYYEYMRFIVDNTGPTTKVSVYNGDTPYITDYVSTQKLTNNYITVCAYFPGTSTGLYGQFDDLTVIDTSSAELTGQIDLQDYPNDKSLVGLRLEFMQTGQPTILKTVLLDSNGQYMATGLTPGTYDVAFKTSQSLRTVVYGVTVPGSQNVSLVNGDVDGDNHVTSTDVSIVLANME